MAKDFSAMEDSNRSANPSIHSVSDPARRIWVHGGLAGLAGGVLAPLLGPLLSGCAAVPATGLAAARPLLGFKAIPTATSDAVVVPEGYVAQPLAPWGEPVGIAGNMPAWRPDAANNAAEQAVQMGMHHDGIHFYPIDGSSTRGLLAMNHEYVDDGLLHPGGLADWSAEKVAKSQAAHGVAVIEVELQRGAWQMVRPSPYARRITARTPFALQGPAAGHALMRTQADPAGRTVLGTLNNCASGKTPWGTYLSGEENFAFYFGGVEQPDAHQARWGLRKAAFFNWPAFDERFDASRHPNEYNRFGWVVEIDPMDATSMPVKRTALGRAAHDAERVEALDLARHHHAHRIERALRGEHMADVAEGVVAPHEAAIDIDVDAPVDDVLPVVAARREPQHLDDRLGGGGVGVARFVPNADAHVTPGIVRR